MRKLTFIIIFFTTTCVFGQYSDCKTALPFCSGPASTIATVSNAGGTVDNETRLSCVDNEGYSTWYTFTASSNGIFNFVLSPLNVNDDYDWALFNITGHTCSDIPNDASLLISCNSFGNGTNNGPTGISTSLGGVGVQNGPGSTNGPPFNADVQVFAGNTYKLMVSNWSQSTTGFRIDVSASTAEDVYSDIGIANFNNLELCKGDTAKIDVDFVGTAFGLLTYNWQPSNLFVNPNIQDPIFKTGLDTTTEIILNLTNGPCSYSESKKIYVGSIEYNKEDKNLNTCIGLPTTLGIDFTGIELPSGLHYTWSPFDLINSSGIPNPKTIPLTDTTQFYFRLKNGPCPEVLDSLIVFIHKDTVKADFDFLINDVENTIPIEVDFTNLSIADASNEWDFGDSSAHSLERSPQQHEYPGYDTYTITLAVQSASSFCVDTARKEIVFPQIIFPNIITPNNDNLNDKLTVTGLKIGTGLMLFNRWGRKVFDVENYLHDWNAEGLPDGMYYYEYIGLEKEITKGWLQVLR